MRTTVNIEDELLRVAKSLARARCVSLGRIISDLMRRGLEQPLSSTRRKQGFPVFAVSQRARPITLEDVKKADDVP